MNVVPAVLSVVMVVPFVRRMSDLVIEMKSIEMGGEKEKMDRGNDSPITKESPRNGESDKWTPSPIPEEEKDTGTLTGKQAWFWKNGMIS